MVTLPSYLLSIEIERLLERGATVSLFSLVIVGSEEEEEKTEAGELSFTESGGETRTMSRKRIQSYLGGFPILQINNSNVCFVFRCFVYIYVVTECNSNCIIKLRGGLNLLSVIV